MCNIQHIRKGKLLKLHIQNPDSIWLLICAVMAWQTEALEKQIVSRKKLIARNKDYAEIQFSI